MIKLRIAFVFIMCFLILVTPVRGESRSHSDLTISVECNPTAIVDSIFTINYTVSYSGKDLRNIKFLFDSIDNDNAKFLYFSRTNQVFNSINKKITQSETWTAAWRAIKAGEFVSPAYHVSIYNEKNVDTLDIQPICKTIRISKPDKQIIKLREKARKEAIKVGKCKDNVMAVAEIAETEYEVGDTIHCRIYLLNKVIDPSSDITDVAIDKNFSVKDASYEVLWFEEIKIDEIDYNDSKYQKIGFAEILIVPQKVGNLKISPLKLYGHKEIPLPEKSFNWNNNMPVVTDTFQYSVSTNPLMISIK